MRNHVKLDDCDGMTVSVLYLYYGFWRGESPVVRERETRPRTRDFRVKKRGFGCGVSSGVLTSTVSNKRLSHVISSVLSFIVFTVFFL